MKKVLKYIGGTLAGLLALWIGSLMIAPSPSFAAPVTSFTATLLPISNVSYDIGTSTQAYRDLYVRQICLTLDSCKTAWPVSGGGGSGSTKWSTSTNNADIQPTVAGTGLNVNASSTFTGNLFSFGVFKASTTALFTNGFTAYASSTLQGFTAPSGSITALTIPGFVNTLVSANSAGLLVATSTIGNNQLQFSSVTVNTSAPLGGGGAVTLGGSALTLTCSTCVTNVTASGNIASSGGTTPNITFTGTLPIASGGTNNTALQKSLLWFDGSSVAATSSQVTLGSFIATTTAVSSLTGPLRTDGDLRASSTALFTSGFTAYASSTLQNMFANAATFGGAVIATSSLSIPTNPALPALTVGQIGIDQTTGQLKYHDGNSTHVLPDEFQFSTFFASSTIGVLGKGATTTLLIVNPRRAATTTSIYCKSRAAGTYTIEIGTGLASTTPIACSTSGTSLDPYTGPNGAFAARADVLIGVGSQTSSSDGVTVTITQAKQAD